MRPQETIQAFYVFLAVRGLKLEAVVVGGAALALLGVIARETRDCDVMVPVLQAEILDAARAFAAEARGRGQDIGDCLALAPTVEELREALAWVQDQDANTLWPEHVEATLADLGTRLGHGV